MNEVEGWMNCNHEGEAEDVSVLPFLGISVRSLKVAILISFRGNLGTSSDLSRFSPLAQQ
jgi:hypothetical protein